MKEKSTSRIYDLWAKVYDFTFGVLVRRRQRFAVKHLPLKPGDRVLDLGVGTGLTLKYFPKDVTVVGMDLSQGMLARAANRRTALNLHHCNLVRADAMHPPFADHSFDHILISHTISVVSDPTRLIRWALRLLRPGGRVVVLNHFRSRNRVVGWLEKRVSPLVSKIGWRSDLCLREIIADTDARIELMTQLWLVDIWKVAVIRHAGDGEPDPADSKRKHRDHCERPSGASSLSDTPAS